MSMVTLKDIALEVGRSVTTVSRALSACSDVSPETIKHVQETAARMGYVPNVLAQRLQKQSTDTIGVVTPISSKGYAEPFFCDFLAGIGEAASQAGLDLMVAYAREDENQIAVYRKLIEERKVDGFIINRTLREDPRIDYLRSVDFPFAVFGQVENQKDYSYIDEDGEFAMNLVADHLVDQGHERIGCLCPPLTFTSAATRLRGLRAGLARHGLTLDDTLIKEGCFEQQDGYLRTLALLDEENPPTAVVGFNDLVAFGAINAAKDRGLKVGKDFAVTGFDDIQMADFYRPPLTTIRQPIKEIGGQVTGLLLKQLQTRRKDVPFKHRQILLKPELIIRESSI